MTEQPEEQVPHEEPPAPEAEDSPHPEETKAAPEGGPPLAPPARPRWFAFLTPAAIVVAGAIIGASLYFSRVNDDSDAAPAEATPAAASEVASTVDGQPPQPQAQPASLFELFRGYGETVGLDDQAYVACLASGEAGPDLERDLSLGRDLGVSATPTFYINGKMVRGAQPFEIFQAVIDAELQGASEYPPEVLELASANPPFFVPEPVSIGVEGAMTLGPEDAPVTIVEFSDFQCPFCGRWVSQVYPRIQAEYGDQVRIVFRHYPLVQIHPNASLASVAAWCAGEQGHFWEMHDLLFERQQEWSTASN